MGETELSNQRDFRLSKADMASIREALIPSVGKIQAEKFLSELQHSLSEPDKYLTQGGTGNCWFVGRLGDLAENEKQKYVDVVKGLVLDAASNHPGQLKDAFLDEEQKNKDVGLGERCLLARAVQRLYVNKFHADENGAVEQLIKDSEHELLHEDVIVAATSQFADGGVDAHKLLETAEGRKLLLRQEVLIQWSHGADLATAAGAKHPYHCLVIEKIENGRVYFREGVKNDHMGGPEGLEFQYDKNGNVTGLSLPFDVVANKTVAFYLSQEKVAKFNAKSKFAISELSYNNPSITIDQFDPSLYSLMVRDALKLSRIQTGGVVVKDSYRELLAKAREDETPGQRQKKENFDGFNKGESASGKKLAESSVDTVLGSQVRLQKKVKSEEVV